MEVEICQLKSKLERNAAIFLEEMDDVYKAIGCVEGEESLMQGIERLKLCASAPLREASGIPEVGK